MISASTAAGDAICWGYRNRQSLGEGAGAARSPLARPPTGRAHERSRPADVVAGLHDREYFSCRVMPRHQTSWRHRSRPGIARADVGRPRWPETVVPSAPADESGDNPLIG